MMNEVEKASCAVKLPDAELVHQALRFLFWAAGQGMSPANIDDAPEPEEALWQYSLRTGDEDWETLAERYRVLVATPLIATISGGREAQCSLVDEFIDFARYLANKPANPLDEKREVTVRMILAVSAALTATTSVPTDSKPTPAAAPKCRFCDGTGYYDYAGFSMDPCHHCREKVITFP